MVNKITKKIVIFIVLALIFIVLSPAFAKKPTIVQLKVPNPNFNLLSSKQLIINYRLFERASVQVKVVKGRKTIKILRTKKAQKPGFYGLKWNGQDSRGCVVQSGTYSVLLADWYTKNNALYFSKKITVKTGNLLFSETFNRPDGLIADNYGKNDSLGRWDVTSQSLYAKDNRGYTSSPIFRVVTNKSDFSNFCLTADMMKTKLGIENWDGLQIFFRYKDYDNLYVTGLRNDNSLHLKKKINGTYYTLAQVPISSNRLNYWYKMKLVAAGKRIQVYVDGQKYIEVTDGSIVSGKVGIRTDNIEAYFDNFTVYSL